MALGAVVRARIDRLVKEKGRRGACRYGLGRFRRDPAAAGPCGGENAAFRDQSAECGDASGDGRAQARGGQIVRQRGRTGSRYECRGLSALPYSNATIAGRRR
jgi:hypothetical protein